MTQINQVYKCEICGNIVEVLNEGAGTLVCCGKNMNLLTENTTDASTEKHVPVILKTSKGVLIKIGEIDHPMEESHYIEWIEVLTKNGSYKSFLKPGDKPQAEFFISQEEIVSVREHCNLHGLWKK